MATGGLAGAVSDVKCSRSVSNEFRFQKSFTGRVHPIPMPSLARVLFLPMTISFLIYQYSGHSKIKQYLGLF